MKRMLRLGSVTAAAALTVVAMTTPPADAARRTVSVSSESAFATPDGTVVCAFSEGTARCDVSKRGYKAPPRPRSCDLDWGDSVYLDRKAGFGCVGDTNAGMADVGSDWTRWFSSRNGIKAPAAYSGGKRQAGLRPGIALRSGNLVCETTTKQAVTCTNVKTKRGFTLSRTSYKLR